MSRFLKKRVPAFLMTLVMVMTLIPMASAKSSADIEYEVDAGDNVTLEFSDFQNYYDKYESDNLYRMEFTDLTDVDSNGRMYAVDFEGDEVRVNEDDLYNSWFYASKSDVEDSGEYRIKGMNYSAGSKADGETAELAFTLYGDKKGKLDGILRIYIGSSGSSKSGTISYSVKSGEEVAFDEDDFQKLYDKSSCTGTFKYLAFDRPSTDYTSAGAIYSRYGKRNETSFSRSALNGNTFGYSDYADGDYDLSDLSFVADSSFTSGSITLSFTLYGGTGSRTNQSTTGTLRYLDGSLPQSDADNDWWNMVYHWDDCPVLAGLDLGDYTSDAVQNDSGSSQELLSHYYIGIRGAWTKDADGLLSGGEVLWQALTAGAVSTVTKEG